jgi:hypothetical protein
VAANWSGGAVPAAGDAVIIDGTGSATCNVHVVTASVNSFTMTAGTLTFEPGAELHVGGTISGAFTLSGGAFDAAGGTVVFDGTTYATYTNTTGATFNNVTMFKSGGASLSLASDLTVTGTLTLTQQNIILGNNNLILNGTLVGGGNNGWLVTDGTGVFTRAGVGGGTDVLFPVSASSSSYNPVIINNSGTTDMFSVRAQTGFTGLVPPVNPDQVVNVAWIITEAVAGGSNVTLTFQYLASDFNSVVFDPTDNYIARYNGTQWVATAATEGGSFPTGPFTSSASGFTAFSAFGITSDLNSLPIQLGSFTASVIQNNHVRLNWMTISELNNYGFFVQKRLAQTAAWTEIAGSFVPGHGTTNVPQYYSYTDNTPLVGATQYRLRQVDLDGTEHFTEHIQVSSPTSVGETAPRQFALLQNYPNPFNPSTEIKFSVEVTAPASLEVFNTLGQKVATLYNDVAEAGKYHTVRFDAANLSSGMYYYRLQSGTRVEMKKLLLVK